MNEEVSKVFVKEKEVVSVVLDPNSELADVDMSDNAFPKKPVNRSLNSLKARTSRRPSINSKFPETLHGRVIWSFP